MTSTAEAIFVRATHNKPVGTLAGKRLVLVVVVLVVVLVVDEFVVVMDE